MEHVRPEERAPVRWHWRNCRSLGFHFSLWLWPWALGMRRDDDVYGGEMWLYVGPISAGLAYSIGNSSSLGLDRFTGLSEAEAHDRAERYEGRANG